MTKVGYKGHRPGTAAERCHQFLDEHSAMDRSKVVAQFVKWGVSVPVAQSWYRKWIKEVGQPAAKKAAPATKQRNSTPPPAPARKRTAEKQKSPQQLEDEKRAAHIKSLEKHAAQLRVTRIPAQCVSVNWQGVCKIRTLDEGHNTLGLIETHIKCVGVKAGDKGVLHWDRDLKEQFEKGATR